MLLMTDSKVLCIAMVLIITNVKNEYSTKKISVFVFVPHNNDNRWLRFIGIVICI